MTRQKILFGFRAAICLVLLLVVTRILFLQSKTQTIRKSFDEIKTSIRSSGMAHFMNSLNVNNSKGNSQIEKPQEIVIVAVICENNRINEILVMMKSALITIKQWPSNVLNHMSLDLHPIHFPADNYEEWKHIFQPCASQRLFLPSLLQNTDAVLYVDADAVFLSSPLKVWEHFSHMNEMQMVGAAPEHEDFPVGWYNRFSKIPYYGDLGLNSGVMLMNLTRMRQFHWEEYVILIYSEYKNELEYPDQDIINIVFHFHPSKLYVTPCNCNFRSDHCMYSNKYPKSVCKTAEEQGLHVLHGNRGVFHDKKEPVFKAIYSSFDQYSFGEDMQILSKNINKSVTETINTDCGKLIYNYLAKQIFDFKK